MLYSTSEVERVKKACPAKCGMCKIRAFKCEDDADFTDKNGYKCSTWSSCERAAGYSVSELKDVREHCRQYAGGRELDVF